MATQKPLLTISLLISNRPETVRKCIESILPILEAIPSELILTDTSKNADMNALCREYTDQVYEFEWVKDFSKARNFGLEKAKGEWFMFLDDDEWFMDVQEIIDFFKSGEYKEYGSADYLTRNFYDPECTQFGDCWVSRMFRRDEDIRYEGIVHEIFTPVRGAKKYIHSTTHHIGYIFLTEEKRKAHSERNITLLFDQLKVDPTNLRWQGQLVLEYRFRADWENEVSFCRECLEGAKNFTTPNQFNHLGTFYAGLIEGLFYLKEYEESIAVCQQALKDARSTELSKALYLLRLAENFSMLDEWEKAKTYAAKYLAEYEILHTQTELMLQQEMALVVRYAFEELNIKKAYAILACCSLKEGNTTLLKKYYGEIPWNLNYTVFYEKMTEVMVDAMATLEYEDIYVQIIKDACKKKEFKIYACAKAQEWESKDDVAFQRLAHIFAQVEDEYWFFWYMKEIEKDIQVGRYGMEVKDEDKLLTISLLISNRPDTIPRCLDSLYQIRKLIPSELILIDTSKNPKIHETLLEYTDQVYEFEWCQDFAKARNFGLKKAKGKWFLFLDDDEWFADVKELIEFFRSGEYLEYERANYQVRNFYDPEYVQYADCWVSRMNRIHPESRFVGKVHEYMEPCTGKEKNIEALVFHSGYIFTTEEERVAHAKRNTDLLKEALKEEPDNIRWRAQLAQEYRSAIDWEALVSYCKEQVESAKDVEIIDPQFGTFYAGLVDGLVQTGEYEEAIQVAESILTKGSSKNVDFLHALIKLCVAECHFELGDWKKASDYAKEYVEMETQIDPQSEQISEQEKILIVQHAFDPAYLKKAYSLMICNDLRQGSTKLLHAYYEKLEWNEVINYVFEKLPSYLIEVMPTLPYESIFTQIIEDSFKREDFKIFMCREALKLEEEKPEMFVKLAYIFALVKDDFWFIWYMKLADATSRQNLFSIEQVSKVDWESCVRSFVSQATKEQIGRTRAWLNRLKDIAGFDMWKMQSYENIIMEKQVMDGPVNLGDLEAYYSVLRDYAQMNAVLDSTAQAAEQIRAYIEVEASDKLQAIKYLKAAVDACPDFAEGISKFISVYSDLEKQRMRKQYEEMQMLRTQVLDQVNMMCANGQTQAAQQILEQLKQMFPEDIEIATLALELRINA